MSENKHFGRGFAGKGYYIALILCAAAIGISGYLYHQNTKQEEKVLIQESVEADVLAIILRIGFFATMAVHDRLQEEGLGYLTPARLLLLG